MGLSSAELPMLEQPSSTRIKIFLSYAQNDAEWRDELVKHLKLLQRQGKIEAWHDGEIDAGDEWATELDQHLRNADIILLLISADFLASDRCYDTELMQAMQRHQAGEAVVIPVWVRDADWEETPFRKLTALPRNGKPVKRWEDRDAAFTEIAREIRSVVQQLASSPKSSETSSTDGLLDHVRSHCCDKIQSEYSKIRLLNFRQIEVDQLYVEVHLLEQLSSRTYARIPDLLNERDLRQDFDRFGLGRHSGKRLPGLNVANRCSRLMVLGKPGAGKSTFLRYLAIACCKGKFLPDHIPVLIELRSIQDADQFNLVNAIHQELELTTTLQQTQTILKTGAVLLLLDGLDEVTDELRHRIQNQIAKFTKTYRHTRIIVTCRTQTVEYILDTFDCVEVADFNPKQVADFAHHWFVTLADSPEQGRELAQQFIATLRSPDHRPTAELSVTPVLLSLTCWVFHDAGDLPTKRTDLYQRGIDLLLEQWDADRGIARTGGSHLYQSLDPEQQQALLSHIAICKYEQQQFALFEQQEIQRYITDYFNQLDQPLTDRNSREILKAIESQHGLIIERARGIYSFSHLTFQEFFAAKWVCDPANHQNLLRFLTETRGQEVIRLALQMPAYADDVARSLKAAIDGILAADDRMQQFLSWVHQKAGSVHVPYKPAAVRVFYFVLVYILDLARDLDLNLNLNLDLARHLDFDFAHTRNLDRDLARDLAHDLGLARDLDLALTLARDFDLARNFDLNPARNVALARDLTRNLARNRDPKSEHDLQILRQQLPDFEQDWNWNDFQQWWRTNAQTWIAQLRAVMIKHRNIGQDWQFSKEQKTLLQQYHDANQRLVDWLKGNCEVSPAVRREIEQTLLLPIAELNPRQ